MRVRWLVLVVLAAGCSGDPARDRLRPGDEVMTVSRNRDTVTIRPPGWTPSHLGQDTKPLFRVQAGTRARVEDDTKPDTADPDAGRDVQILVLEGESKGRVGVVYRMLLRPVAK